MPDYSEGLYDGRDLHEISIKQMRVEFLDRIEGEDVVDFAKRVALAVSQGGVIFHMQNPENPNQIIIVITSPNQPQDPPRGFEPTPETIAAIQSGQRNNR